MMDFREPKNVGLLGGPVLVTEIGPLANRDPSRTSFGCQNTVILSIITIIVLILLQDIGLKYCSVWVGRGNIISYGLAGGINCD